MKDRALLQAMLNASIAEQRTDSFQQQMPASGFIYYDLKLNPATDLITINGKPVKKLRYLLEKQSLRNSCLYITFADGNKVIIGINPGKEEGLREAFANADGVVQQISFIRMDQKAIPWEKTSVKEAYDPRQNPAEEMYGIIHELLMQSLLKIISDQQLKKVNIVDGGCGNGKLLKATEASVATTFNKDSVTVAARYFGFDFNSKNVADCKLNYQGACVFVQGNLLKIDELLKAAAQQKNLDPKSPTVIMLSGSLTRLVLNNMFEAVQVLQRCALYNADYLLISGLTEPLLNDFIAKRIGYKRIPMASEDDVLKTPDQIGLEAQSYAFRQMTRDEILQNKIKKIKKHNFLDLSFSVNPQVLLQDLEKHLNDKMVIDLSYCDLTAELISSLSAALKKNPGIRLIYWHWDIAAIERFNKQFEKNVFMLKLITNEGYLMAPRGFFLSLQASTPSAQHVEAMAIIRERERLLKAGEAKVDNPMANMPSFSVKTRQDIYSFITSALELKKADESLLGVKVDAFALRLQRKYESPAAFRIEVTDEQGFQTNVLIEHELKEYIAALEKRFSEGDVLCVPELIFIYHNGILQQRLLEENPELGDSVFVGNSLEKEILLYQLLAKKYPDKFPADKMRQIMGFVIADAERNALISGSALAAIKEQARQHWEQPQQKHLRQG